MKTVGLCTHFNETDEWAFDYALRLARKRQFQLNICHWLASPYTIRRDVVYSDLFFHDEAIPVTPELLNQLELKLRQYYEPRLGDFTDVAFKLCEGAYQIELLRCFRNHLLDLVVLGYQAPVDGTPAGHSLEFFSLHLPYPMIIVGADGPDTFLLNAPAYELIEQLDLPAGSWNVLEDANVSWQVLQPSH